VDSRSEITGISLCSGGGGIDLALANVFSGRYRCLAFCEREAYPAAVLAARMEEALLSPAPIWDDVATFPSELFRDKVHILHVGYPCQPFSQAGKRLGEADPRHLWPHIRRHIEIIQPEWCFFENVRGHLTLGFEQVWGDLRGLGYEVEAGLFSAAEVGAPHLRERLYILAHRNQVANSFDVGQRNGVMEERQRECQTMGRKQLRQEFGDSDRSGNVAHTKSISQRESDHEADSITGVWKARQILSSGSPAPLGHPNGKLHGHGHDGAEQLFPRRTQGNEGCRDALRDTDNRDVGRDVGGGLDGIPLQLDCHLWPAGPGPFQYEWEPARVSRDCPDRAARLKLLGNAVVPQTAALAFRTLAARLGF